MHRRCVLAVRLEEAIRYIARSGASVLAFRPEWVVRGKDKHVQLSFF